MKNEGHFLWKELDNNPKTKDIYEDWSLYNSPNGRVALLNSIEDFITKTPKCKNEIIDAVANAIQIRETDADKFYKSGHKTVEVTLKGSDGKPYKTKADQCGMPDTKPKVVKANKLQSSGNIEQVQIEQCEHLYSDSDYMRAVYTAASNVVTKSGQCKGK